MVGFLVRLVVNTLALLAMANYSGGSIEVKSNTAAVIAVLVLGLVNAFIKPVVLFVAQIVTCALSILTLGLWSLVLAWFINGVMFLLVSALVPGFEVKGLWVACWAALVMAIINALLTLLLQGDRSADAR